MARNTVRLFWEGDASGFKRSGRDVETTLDRTERSAKETWGGISRAATIGGAALVAAGVKSAGAASALGEQVSKNSLVFRGSAKEIEAWAKTTADSAGLSQRAALEATGTFGSMLIPMGLVPRKAAEMSKGLVQLSGDLASFNDANPEEVLEALRSGLSGETEPLRRFGVFLNAARVEAEAFRLGLVKTSKDQGLIADAQTKVNLATEAYSEAARKHGQGSEQARRALLGVHSAERALEKALQGTKVELTAAQKAQATYSLILNDTKTAQGDFARTSDSLANQQRIARAELENTAAALGQRLIPAATAAVGAFSDVVRWTGEHERATQAAALAAAGLAGTIVTTNAAFATYTTATRLATASTWALNTAIGANPIVRGAAIVAAIAGVGWAHLKLRDDVDVSGAAFREAKDSVNAYEQSLRDLRIASHELRDAKLALTGAELRVERAQAAVDALPERAKGTLRYREAVLALKQAKRDLADAEERVGAAEKKRTDERAKSRSEVERSANSFKGLIEAHRKAEEQIALSLPPIRDATGALIDQDAAVQQNAGNVDEFARKMRALAVDVGKTSPEYATLARKAAEYAEITGRIPTARQTREFIEQQRWIKGNVVPAWGDLGKALSDHNEKAETGRKRSRELRDSWEATGGKAKDAKTKTDDLADAILKVPPRRKSTIDVEIKFSLPRGFRSDAFNRGGSGDGLGAAIHSSALGMARANAPTVPLSPNSSIDQHLWDELAIGQMLGLYLSSGHRPGARTRSGNPSYHGHYPSDAIDMASGSTAGYGDPAMRAFFDFAVGRPGLAEVILDPYLWTPGGGIRNIAGTQLARDHRDHVHAGGPGDGLGVGAFTLTGSRLNAFMGDGPGKGKRKLKDQLEQLPAHLELAIAKAERTRTKRDDIAAARREIAFWRRQAGRTGHYTKRALAEAYRNLASAEGRLRDLRSDARPEAADPLTGDLPPRLEEAIFDAEGTETIEDDKVAIGNALAYLRAKLAKAKTPAERLAIKQAIRNLEDRMPTITRLAEPPGPSGPDPDLQAQLAQANARLGVATRSVGLSDAFVRALGLPGLPASAGGGGAAGAAGAPIVVFQTTFPPTPQMAQDAAAAVAQGFGLQGHRDASREVTGV